MHPFRSFGEQRNWAIDNIAHKYDWIFHLDADEQLTSELLEEMATIIARGPVEAGFYVPHKMMFMDRWVRHAEGYPIYQARLFHRDRMRFQDYGHGQREDTDGILGRLAEPYLHYNFSKGLSDWLEKHNRYSTLEARMIVEGRQTGGRSLRASPFGTVVQRRRFFKDRVYPELPGKWISRFVWMYVLNRGFQDGIAGLYYCLLMSTYELFTSVKVWEMRRGARGMSERHPTRAVAAPSLSGTVHSGNGHAAIARPSAMDSAASSGAVHVRESVEGDGRESSPWTTREKIGRVLWMVIRGTLFRPSFHNWYWWRNLLLRCFGARIGRNVRIRPTVAIEIPWNLEVGDYVRVGDCAILYSLGHIRIGRLAVVSQYSHLCAGTHDYTDPRFTLRRLPIVIEAGAWIAADAFIGPAVTVGENAVVGVRASVFKNVPAHAVVGGNPARIIKQRSMRIADGNGFPANAIPQERIRPEE